MEITTHAGGTDQNRQGFSGSCGPGKSGIRFLSGLFVDRATMERANPIKTSGIHRQHPKSRKAIHKQDYLSQRWQERHKIPMDEKINLQKVLDVIYGAIDALNDSLPKDRRIEKSPQASLFDQSGAVDSLGLTLLIVGLEQKIEKELGVRVTLVNDAVMDMEGSPFKNVSTLASYISKLVAEQNG